MNYQIIKDSRSLIDFINWLPELQPHETYYLSLLARNKYIPAEYRFIKKDKLSLKRVTATKDLIYTKIRQMEVEYGAYSFEGGAST